MTQQSDNKFSMSELEDAFQAGRDYQFNYDDRRSCWDNDAPDFGEWFKNKYKNLKTSAEEETTAETIQIGSQVWMKDNLNVTHYRNGDEIPQVQDPREWAKLTTGAWCYYDNNPENGKTYGKLYNWYAVTDPRGLVPDGWHVPSDGEWTMLIDYLGGVSVAGGKMKEIGTSHWNSPNTGADNSSGFTALLGGYRYTGGAFYSLGYDGYWWSATEYDAANAWGRNLYYSYSNAYRYDHYKSLGFSVRCVRD